MTFMGAVEAAIRRLLQRIQCSSGIEGSHRSKGKRICTRLSDIRIFRIPENSCDRTFDYRCVESQILAFGIGCFLEDDNFWLRRQSFLFVVHPAQG